MSNRQIHHAGDNITGVAVAIRRQSSGNTHTGILCRHEDGQLILVHLQWDYDLAYEVFDGTYSWVVPSLLTEEQNDIRGVCRAIARCMPHIHYSFKFDTEAKLDPDTAALISEAAPFGLTCSTFVMAVFKSAELQLIQAAGWPERVEDERWYQRLVKHMGNTGVDPEHIAKVEKDVKVIRVRPEETAGACLESYRQVEFARASQNGLSVMEQFDRRFDKKSNKYTKEQPR